jgi:hypothetical protein
MPIRRGDGMSQWEVSWSNIYEGESNIEAIRQALGELADAVNGRVGATLLRVRNANTGDVFTYDMESDQVLDHFG